MHTNARELRLGGESGCETGHGRLEYMGSLFGDGVSAGLFVGYGHIL